MKPTVIGGKKQEQQNETIVVESEQTANLPAIVPSTFPIVLSEDQLKKVEVLLEKTPDIVNIKLQDIATLGSEEEMRLHQTLNGFLSRIDQFDNPRLFKLVNELTDVVEKENLGELADRILDGKLTLGDKLRNLFTKKGMEEAMEKVWEETKNLLRGKTKTLVDIVTKLESGYKIEQQKVGNGIVTMDQLKLAYREHFKDFVVVCAFMAGYFERSKNQVAMIEQSLDSSDVIQQSDFKELQLRLQALESREIAHVGTMTKFPADYSQIQDLQGAAIQTLQETSTTAASRFASIKMTLITLNNALITRGLQQIAEKGAALDRNLAAVRGRVTKDVVTKAANAPGDNRKAQAEMIQKIVRETAELKAIVEQAKTTNAQKFSEARQSLEASRQELLALGTHVS